MRHPRGGRANGTRPQRGLSSGAQEREKPRPRARASCAWRAFCAWLPAGSLLRALPAAPDRAHERCASGRPERRSTGALSSGRAPHRRPSGAITSPERRTGCGSRLRICVDRVGHTLSTPKSLRVGGVGGELPTRRGECDQAWGDVDLTWGGFDHFQGGFNQLWCGLGGNRGGLDQIWPIWTGV